jgi:hypothetical protein
MAKSATPGWVGEGFLSLQAESVARYLPAHPIYDSGADQWGRSNDGQERLATPRCYGGEDVANVGGLPRCNRPHDGGKLSQVGAQLTGW